MLLKISQAINIDDIKINFDTSGLWVLNIAIAIIMFGVALGITIDDFKRLFRAHERFEDEIFYPKLDEELDDSEKQLFIDRHKEIILG